MKSSEWSIVIAIQQTIVIPLNSIVIASYVELTKRIKILTNQSSLTTLLKGNTARKVMLLLKLKDCQSRVFKLVSGRQTRYVSPYGWLHGVSGVRDFI